MVKRLAAVLGVLFVVAAPSLLGAQGVTREAILRAEDARGRGPQGIAPLLAGLRDPALRTLAIRALGRLERPEVADTLLPFLADPQGGAEAANAVAQALRGLASQSARTTADDERLNRAMAALVRAARAEQRPAARGAMARSLARLPYADSLAARAAERVLVSLAGTQRVTAEQLPAVEGVAAGLYTFARQRRTLGEPLVVAAQWIRDAAVVRPGDPAAAPVRRLGWLSLNALRIGDSALVRVGLADADPQVRRLAVLALPNVADSGFRRAMLAASRRDTSFMVRIDWVNVHRQVAPAECGPLLQAIDDSHPLVGLAAIDALTGPCTDRSAVRERLQAIIAAGPRGAVPPKAVTPTWHAMAHALVTLARVDSSAARSQLQTHSTHGTWQVRMYAARAAGILRDTVALNRLAFDSIGSVREVAIGALAGTVGHGADLVYVRALSSPDYHVVLAAGQALRGTTARDTVLPALVAAFERLSARQEQTSRDPRMALLARIDELGGADLVPRLTRFTTDVDPGVAAEVARIVRRLAPSAVVESRVAPLGASPPLVSGPVTLRVTMAEGVTFDVALDTEQAPLTASWIVDLVRKRHYDGLTWHRLAPNFVLQGGSPAMNEYVGIGPFMRDELGLPHHDRSTLGISTRGRDTGDAQWFFNLVDNYRLDHEYTVFGRVVRGMDAVDRLLEGARIESIRVVEGR